MSNPFTSPDLTGTHCARATMVNAHFDGLNLSGAQFFAVLTDATFTDTNLANATFDDVNLGGSSLNNVNLSNSKITYANLSNLNISGVTLENASISDANLEGMRLNCILVTDLLAAYETAK